MATDGSFAPRRFLLPAFSALWLLVLFVSLFHAPVYLVGAKVHWHAWTAIVESPDPELAAQGIKPGTPVETGHMSFASILRLRAGAPYNTLIPIAVSDGTGARTVYAHANRPYVSPGSKRSLEIWTNAVTLTLSLMLVGYLGYRRPGVMVLALMLFIAGGGITWPNVGQAISAAPDWIFTPVVWTLSILCGVFPSLVLASFVIRLPGDDPLPEKRKIIPVVDGVVIAGFVLASLANSNAGIRVFGTVSAIVVAAAAVLSLRYARAADRARVAIVFAAVMIGGVGYALLYVGLTFVDSTPISYWVADISVALVPSALAYAILRHRVFDIGFVLNRTIVYGLTSAFLIVLLAALEFGAEHYIDTMTKAEGIALQFCIALAVTISAGFAHRRIDRAVDNVLFRTRHQQEEALRRFATTAQFYTAQEPLVRDTVDALTRFARVGGAALYLVTAEQMRCEASEFRDAPQSIDENDPGYVALRAHRDVLDLHDVKTAFPGERLYPMVLAGRLAGAIATGQREHGEAIAPDIDEAIRRIASAVAIALAAIESDRIRDENTSLRQRLGVQAV